MNDLRLNLGCGTGRMEGFVNCDYLPTAYTDAVFDACGPWPFKDDSVEHIYASHMLEHLPDPQAFFREAWRVLRPSMSTMLLRVPHGGHRAAWWDLGHLRPWFPESFCFLQPGYAQAVRNPQHDAWTTPFDVQVIQLRLAPDWAWRLRSRWRRKLLWTAMEMANDWCEELFIHVAPLKSPEAVAAWHAVPGHQGNLVPIMYTAWRHHMQRRPLPAGQPAEMVSLIETNALGAFF